MKLETMSTVVAGAVLSLCGMATAAQPQARTFTLSNGIRVVSIHIPESKHVSIFSYLPMGLARDGPGRTQWSHLIEHLTIRSTMPPASQQANAETLPDHMRLDFYGTIDNWQKALAHHARWLSGAPFTQDSLQREKLNVKAECDFVAEKLATHKFAMAAWAQGYRHGRTTAYLKADIDKAALGEIQQYRDAHLVVLDKLVVCVVGGVDGSTVEGILNRELSPIKSVAKPAAPVKLHQGNRNIVWDIDARHLVLTWPIPAFDRQEYAELMVAGNWLMMKFFTDAELKKLAGMTLAGADLIIPEGNFFYVSASVRPQVSFEDVLKRIDHHIQQLCSVSDNSLEMPMIGRQLSFQLTTLMDPQVLMAQAPNMSRAMLEANLALQWAMHEFRYSQHRPSLAKALAAVTAGKAKRAAVTFLSEPKRSICRIEPEQK